MKRPNGPSANGLRCVFGLSQDAARGSERKNYRGAVRKERLARSISVNRLRIPLKLTLRPRRETFTDDHLRTTPLRSLHCDRAREKFPDDPVGRYNFGVLLQVCAKSV